MIFAKHYRTESQHMYYIKRKKKTRAAIKHVLGCLADMHDCHIYVATSKKLEINIPHLFYIFDFLFSIGASITRLMGNKTLAK